MKNSVESVENAAEKKERRNIKVMDLILVIVGVSLLVFTIVMIQLFKVYGTVPDTLITCVFATLGGECGIMGWIKTTKDRNRERKWEQEDKQEEEHGFFLLLFLLFLNFLFRFLCIFFPYSFIRSQLPKKPWQSIFPIV